MFFFSLVTKEIVFVGQQFQKISFYTFPVKTGVELQTDKFKLKRH